MLKLNLSLMKESSDVFFCASTLDIIVPISNNVNNSFFIVDVFDSKVDDYFLIKQELFVETIENDFEFEGYFSMQKKSHLERDGIFYITDS